AAHSARASSRARARGRRRRRRGRSLAALPLCLDYVRMGARDLGPRATGIQLEIALPVTHRLVAAPGARQRAGEVEVRVGVVRRDVERAAVASNRLVDVAGILVQRAEVVRGLGALARLAERTLVRGAGLRVAARAAQ